MFCCLGCQMFLLSISHIFCPLIVGLALHRLSSVTPPVQYPAFPIELDCHTKNLHLTTLFLCFKQNGQTPDCSMFELLYVFRNIELFCGACNDSTVVFGNRHLNILNGMRLPHALESILCYFGLVLIGA